MKCSHIVQLIISMIALAQASEFFLIADPSVSAGAGALQNCRRECAAATRGTGIGGYLAWILNEEESNEVINLMSSTSSSDFSLGGSRLTDGSTWYWTENKHATLLAHNSQGVPFYEGVTVTQDGHAINGAFNAFCPSEPNNGGDPPTSETHVVVRYCPAGWGWNDATIHSSNGCVCRRFQSASSSYNNFSLSYPTPSLSDVTSGTMSRSDGTGTLFSNSRTSNTPTATYKSFSSGTSQSSTCFSLSSSELLSTTIARSSNSSSVQPSVSKSNTFHITCSPSVTVTIDNQSGSASLTQTASASRWACGFVIFSDIRCQFAPLNVTEGVLVVLSSFSGTSSIVSTLPSSVLPTLVLTSSISRAQLASRATLAINIYFLSPPNIVWYEVTNITLTANLILNASTVKSTSAAAAWWVLLVECPTREEGWLQSGLSPYADTTVELHITMSCNDVPVLLVVVSIPSPGDKIPLAVAAQVVGGYAHIASGVLSTASGTGVGRVVATSSLSSCDASASVGGGLIDFNLEICTVTNRDNDDDLTRAVARSAVVSNMIVLCATMVVSVLAASAWACLRRVSVAHAAAFLCMPSLLLPVLIAIVPSTSTAATYMLGQILLSSCGTVDAILGVLGLLLSLAPSIGVLLVWFVMVRGSSSAWRCAHVPEVPTKVVTAGFFYHIWWWISRCLSRTWWWEPATASRACAWILLMDCRLLWYAAIDSFLLAVFASIAVAGGQTSLSSVCSALIVLVAVLLFFQFVLVCTMQPFTTRFAQIFAATTLLLTTLSVVAQSISFATSASADSWLLQSSAFLNLLTLGISSLKMLLDVVQLCKGIVRRFSDCCDTRYDHSALSSGVLTGEPITSHYMNGLLPDTLDQMEELLLINLEEEEGQPDTLDDEMEELLLIDLEDNLGRECDDGAVPLLEQPSSEHIKTVVVDNTDHEDFYVELPEELELLDIEPETEPSETKLIGSADSDILAIGSHEQRHPRNDDVLPFSLPIS